MIRNKASMSSLITPFRRLLEVLASIRQEETKGVQIGKEELKLFIDDTENPKESTTKHHKQLQQDCMIQG